MSTDLRKALDLRRAATYVGSSPRTLADARWRERVGLPATRIGRRLVFLIRDLDALLTRSREQMPVSPTLQGDGQ
jgi:hypothetical protein